MRREQNKQKILNYAKQHGVSKASRKFKIAGNTIRKWLDTKPQPTTYNSQPKVRQFSALDVDEIIFLICTFLQLPDIVHNVGTTCKRWRRVSFSVIQHIPLTKFAKQKINDNVVRIICTWCTTLTSMNLAHSEVTPRSLSYLMKHSKTLYKIDFSYCFGLLSNQSELLIFLKQCQNLKQISLNGLGVNEKLLSVLPNQLIELRIGGADIKDFAMTNIIQKSVDTLQSIDIMDTKLTDVTLFELCKCTELTTVSVSKCLRISKKGIRQLVRNCKKLQSLDISFSPICNQAVLRVISKRAKKLKYLRINEGWLTQKDLINFRSNR